MGRRSSESKEENSAVEATNGGGARDAVGSYPCDFRDKGAKAYACHGFPSSFHTPSIAPPPLISSTTLQAITQRAPMASSSSFITSRPTFPFPRLPLLHPTAKLSKACSFPTFNIKKPHLFSFKSTTISSVDVSKEDKPLSEPESLDKAEDKEKENKKEEQSSNLDPRRFEEKFAVLNTGIYECRSCGYRYDEAAGDPSYPIAPGFQFGKLPEDWRCPTCGAAKSFFESKSVEIAGFAQNQEFGFGANTLTSGQKAFLIYGGLLLGFIFFLSGYFLQ